MFPWKYKEKYSIINPFMPSELFYLTSLDRSISYVIMWLLIWVWTVCHCPFYKTSGLNGLMITQFDQLLQSNTAFPTSMSNYLSG